MIPNSGIVCTEDLVYPYEVEQIHPCQKQPVGERLALQALSKTYGMKGLFSECMTFKEMKIVGDTVKVHFDNTYGAYNRFEDIEGFEVAGEDKVFHKATAKHFRQEGNDPWNECVIVTSPEVKKPVAFATVSATSSSAIWQMQATCLSSHSVQIIGKYQITSAIFVQQSKTGRFSIIT